MILRKYKWTLFLSLPFLSIVGAQNARSYDTNDWIPITPSVSQDNTKKATGRVLNLDSPNQNFFPDENYIRKQQQPQQYLRDPLKSANYKVDHPYTFESVPPLPVRSQPPPPIQYVRQPQYVQQYNTQQPVLSQQLVAPPRPPQKNQNYYDTSNEQPYRQQLEQAEYKIPLNNNSFYQSLNPGAINQEILGAIQHNPNVVELPATTLKPQEKENVQLLYVPLESLKPNQPQTQPSQSQTVFTEVEPPIARQEKQVSNRIQNPNKQHQLLNIESDFIRQALNAHKLQQKLELGQPIVFQASPTVPSTTTTTASSKPKKRKPNQPPLAVYMGRSGSADVKDVLEVLKHANSIAVQDSVGPNSPQVFVGPSNLKQSDGYTKFPLPYLSTVEGNRIERKVDQLPFFVAPLSYKTPEGYSKIPLPSPHVGSVVVSTKEELHEKHPITRQSPFIQNQLKEDFDVKNPFEPQSPYLLNHNQFLTDYQVNSRPQNVEDTSTKNFLTSIQQGNLNNDFQPTTSNNFQYDYQTTPRYQEQSRPITQNFNIPEQQTFIQNYQSRPKYPVVDESFIASKTPADVFSFTEPPSRYVSTTTESTTPKQFKTPQNVQSIFENTPEIPRPTVLQYQQDNIRPTLPERQPTRQFESVNQPDIPSSTPQYRPVSNENIDPLRPTISQYELEQINQFIGENDQIRTTAPPARATESYDISTTSRSQSRIRGRQRGRTTTTTSTTSRPLQRDSYTVLEEFSIKPKATTTAKYTTEVETIPANVYKLTADQLEPVYDQKQEDAPTKQHVLNQEALDDQILHRPVSSIQPDAHQSPLVFNRGQQIQPDHQQQQNDYQQQQYEPQQKHQQHQYQPEQHQQHQYQPEQQQQQYQSQSEQEYQPQYHSLQKDELTGINPFLPGLINNLQDHAIKSLLLPGLLVPTTEKLSTTSPLPLIEEITQRIQEVSTTTTEAPQPETTTTKRGRGRQRGSSARYTVPTSSAPRRTVSRRRPAHTRTTTERTISRATTEPVVVDYEATRRPASSRQRFRTKGRPVQVTERVIQTTGAENANSFREPILQGGFQASQQEPQSYMQFEHSIKGQQIVSLKPEIANEGNVGKEYHQVYNVPSETPATQRIIDESSRPVYDVHISHSTPEKSFEPEIITVPNRDTQFIKVNANIRSGGVIHNNRNEEFTTKQSVRVRGRGRSRIKTEPTTARPVITTTPRQRIQAEAAEEEFYGFIRSPSFQKPAPLVHTTTEQSLYSSTYRSSPRTLIQIPGEEITERQDISTPIHFIGEIRPKYQSTTEEAITQPPKVRARPRIRVPAKKPVAVKTEEETTRRSTAVRSRSRGNNHFKLPDNSHQKRDEADIEGGNYPAGYLKSREVKEIPTEKPQGFQITVDPYEADAMEADQVPHSSIHRPKIVPNPHWVDASILPPLNDIPIEEDKEIVVTSNFEESTTTEGEEFAAVTTTETINETTTTKKKGRRRGVWKLVKQRPVDHFEGAESQNYQSVLNSFDEIHREKEVTTEKSIFDAIYNMFGLAEDSGNKKDKNVTASANSSSDILTTTISPTFPDEYTTEQISTTVNESETDEVVPATTTTESSVVNNYEVKPWDMKEVKTSTSTEVSHETEICYKGRCVKSKEKKTI